MTAGELIFLFHCLILFWYARKQLNSLVPGVVLVNPLDNNIVALQIRRGEVVS